MKNQTLTKTGAETSAALVDFGKWKMVKATVDSPYDPEYGIQIPSVATLWIDKGHPVAKEIATLIAAAPELLEALRETYAAIPCYYADGESNIQLLGKISLAIKKATGKE